MDTKPIADLHCHPSLKSFRNKEWYPSIWRSGKNKKPKDYFKGFLGLSARGLAIKTALKEMATYSQTSLDDCFKGSNRLVFCSIYPFERPFIKPDRPFNNAKWSHRVILNTVIFRRSVTQRAKEIDAMISGLLAGASITEYFGPTIERIHDPNEERYLYYDEYQAAIDYLIAQNNTQPEEAINGVRPTFKLIANYEELKQFQDKAVICGIITVEGMHSYANYRKKDIHECDSITDIDFDEQQNLENQFITAIAQAKSESYVPYFITFAHHFNNLLVGHATSFINSTNAVKPGFDQIFNQNPGLNQGISEIGKRLILDHLLSRTNGPRILIDIKHMSIQSRMNYYDMIRSTNEGASRHTKIPIICSHAAVNGFENYAQAQEKLDRKENENNSFVSRFNINLTDKDITEIFDSDGLIGICMHDGRMPGGVFRKKLKKAKGNIGQLKKLHIQMFLTNVFHVVKVNLAHIHKRNENRVTSRIDVLEAWKTLALGSDYDGIVNPFDGYNTAAKFTSLKTDVIHYLDNYQIPIYAAYQIMSLAPKDEDQHEIEASEISHLMQGQSAEDLADRIFYNNTDLFLSKYFTKHYLTSLTDNLIS